MLGTRAHSWGPHTDKSAAVHGRLSKREALEEAHLIRVCRGIKVALQDEEHVHTPEIKTS